MSLSFIGASCFFLCLVLLCIVYCLFQDLLREHVVITLFLTMLVGAGGNAGNQSAIKVRLAHNTNKHARARLCVRQVVIVNA